MLARHLPDGAMLHASLGNDAAWSTEAHLMAHLIDVGQIANWQRGGDTNVDKPERWPRPGDARRGKAKGGPSTIETQARRFAARKAEADKGVSHGS